MTAIRYWSWSRRASVLAASRGSAPDARASAAALNVGRCSRTSWLTPARSRNAVTASMPCACVVLMTVVLPVANGATLDGTPGTRAPQPCAVSADPSCALLRCDNWIVVLSTAVVLAGGLLYMLAARPWEKSMAAAGGAGEGGGRARGASFARA